MPPTRLHVFFAALVLASALALGAAPAAAQDALPDRIAALEARLAQSPADTTARLELAALLVDAGRQEDAIAQYERAVAQDSTNADAYRRLATLYSWNARPEDAVRAYERITELAPDDLDVRRTLAQQYFWTERSALGIRQLEAVVERAPDDLDARRQLAQQYAWNERPADAAVQLEAIVAQDPSDLDALGRLAQQRLWDGDLAGASVLYARLVDARPDSTEARLTLAKTLLWTERAEQAMPVFERVLAEDPDNAEALFLVGELQRWNGSWDEARRRLRRARALGADAERIDELLRGIRTSYGPRLQAGYQRIEDSNALTRERIPVDGAVWTSPRWTFEAAAAYTRVSDGRLDTSVDGFDAAAAATYTLPGGAAVRGRVGVSAFSSNWSPLTAELRVTQNFFGRLFATARLTTDAATDGVRALEQAIRTTGLAVEAYAQATDRLGLSALLHTTAYSDDNQRLTAGASAFYTLRRALPSLQLAASYAFEDTRDVYPASTPYWTPDALSTTTGRVIVEQRLVGPLQVGGGLGLTMQQGVTSTNYAVRVGLADARFHTLLAEYEKSGSEVFSAETVTLRYAYRF